MTVLLKTTLTFKFKNKLKRQPGFSHVPPLQQAHWKWVGMDLAAPHSALLLGLNRGWQLTLAVRSWRGTGSFASALRYLLIAEDLWDSGVWSCICTISTGTLLPCSLQWCSSEHVHPSLCRSSLPLPGTSAHPFVSQSPSSSPSPPPYPLLSFQSWSLSHSALACLQ